MPGFDIAQMAGGRACSDGAVPPSVRSDMPSNITETARRYRYLFETLEPLNQNNLLLYAYKITRPSIEIDQITIHNGQDEIYRPGKSRWRPIDVTFYERIFESEAGEKATSGYDQPAELIYQWWSKTMINIDNSLHGELNDYRKPSQITMLDGLGNTIWAYYLAQCWPTKVTPSDLSYAETEIADITVTLSYDKAIEKRVI